MASLEARIINAFVDAGVGGNPAGVVLNAERFTQAEKQQIAARVGVSETAFVSPSNLADYKLEFFTPTRQIAHCGHATIATFSYLAQQGQLKSAHTSKETIDGRREIFISGEMAFMEQMAPRYTSLKETSVDLTAVLSSLGLSHDGLLPGKAPMVVNTGNSFLIFPLKSENVLLNLRPDFDAIERISADLGLIGYYAFSLQTRIAGRDAGTRMFAPLYGIKEESATGMAAGPLACYLHDILGNPAEHFMIEQGHFMASPSPSILVADLTVHNGKIDKLMVGGKAVVSKIVAVNI